jgi:putative flippase GtrA
VRPRNDVPSPRKARRIPVTRTIDAPVIRRQFTRWFVVGVTTNAALYLAYIALTRSLLTPKVAMSVVYVTGVVIGFIANRSWSFGHTGPAQSAFLRYVAAYALGYVVNYVGLHVGIVVLGVPHELVQAVMIVVVAAMTFVMQKYYVFAAQPDPDSLDASQSASPHPADRAHGAAKSTR